MPQTLRFNSDNDMNPVLCLSQAALCHSHLCIYLSSTLGLSSHIGQSRC